MTLKGVTAIDRIINNFLKPFECEARLGSDFSYGEVSEVITYALVVSDKSSAQFMASIERFDPAVSADVFLWSLLHELGHHETLWELEDWERDISDTIKREINEGKRDELEYYTTPVEEAATRWAVEYVDTHIEEVGKFWAILSPAIKNFFEKNEISA